jgi:tRNA threonylcarbamoyladenosine biosynthesis protein TsaB
MSPVLLAFDTSTESMAVALQWPGGVLTWNGPGGAQASVELLPRIREWMTHAGLDWRDLDAMAFGRGPGAFTGLRTACAVAQGLAYGAGKPVLPIDSLLIVAEDACGAAGNARSSGALADSIKGFAEIGVVMDARMGEVYAARYLRANSPAEIEMPAGKNSTPAGPGLWHVLDAPALCHPADLSALWADRPPRLVGTGLPLTAWPHDEADRETDDRAAALLRLAGQAWQQGCGVDAAQALPLYLRDKVALTTAERAAARNAAGGAAAGRESV